MPKFEKFDDAVRYLLDGHDRDDLIDLLLVAQRNETAAEARAEAMEEVVEAARRVVGESQNWELMEALSLLETALARYDQAMKEAEDSAP